MEGLHYAHKTYPNMKFSARLTELERDEFDETSGMSKIMEELRTSMLQSQLYWLILPMCDDTKDVQEYVNMINSIDPQWLKNHGSLQIICETPWGLKNLDDMLGEYPEIKAVTVGGGDYFRFAQCKDNLFLPQFRFDVLNACLRHGRLPIDTPPMALDIDVASNHFQSSRDSGFCSATILHPLQTQCAHQILSPYTSDIAKQQRVVIEPWLEKRETGYKMSSGEDFVGPPHLKLMHWDLQYYDHVHSNKVTYMQDIDQSQIPKILSLLSSGSNKRSADVDDGTTNVFSGIKDEDVSPFMKVLLFLALGNCHDRHEDLLLNLGFSDFKLGHDDLNLNGDPVSLANASYVISQVIGRRVTTKGNVVVTCKIQIMSAKHQTLCTFERRIVERKLHFDTIVSIDEDASLDEKVPSSQGRLTVDCIQSLMSKGELVESVDSKSAVSLDHHNEFCRLLNLDAPVHHSGAFPTLPSTLHLSHHNLFSSAVQDIDNWIFKSINFHSPMKPESDFTSSTYFIEDLKSTQVAGAGSGPAYLSILNSTAEEGGVLSSILIQPSDPDANDFILKFTTLNE